MAGEARLGALAPAPTRSSPARAPPRCAGRCGSWGSSSRRSPPAAPLRGTPRSTRPRHYNARSSGRGGDASVSNAVIDDRVGFTKSSTTCGDRDRGRSRSRIPSSAAACMHDQPPRRLDIPRGDRRQHEQPDDDAVQQIEQQRVAPPGAQDGRTQRRARIQQVEAVEDERTEAQAHQHEAGRGPVLADRHDERQRQPRGQHRQADPRDRRGGRAPDRERPCRIAVIQVGQHRGQDQHARPSSARPRGRCAARR